MWDLIDPRTNQYRASVVTIGSVECTAYAPVVGCVAHRDVAEAYAGTSGRVTAEADPTSDGSPAHLYIEYTIKQTRVATGARKGEAKRRVAADDDDDDDELDDTRGVQAAVGGGR